MNHLTRIKISWLINLRWAAISMMLILCPIALHFGYLYLDNIYYYLSIPLALTIFNLISLSHNFLWPKKISLQLIIDLLAFTLLIFISSKIENPFWPLIYFHAALAAIILPPKKDLLFLPFLYISLAFIQLSSLEFYSSIALTLLPQWIILTAIWFLTRNLSLYTENQRSLINKLKERELKNQKLKSLAALSSGILHEINTPLNTIRLKIDRMKTKGLENVTQKDLETMDLSLKSIEDVSCHLNYSEYPLGEKEISIVEFNSFFTKQLHWMNKIAPEIKIQFNKTKDLFLRISPNHFMIVLKNIIENAKEAQATKIDFSLHDENPNKVRLQYIDNSHGFSDTIIEYFGSPYTTTKGKGHGIGLYSSLLCMESMGGNLTIENTKKHSAQINIYLEKSDET